LCYLSAAFGVTANPRDINCNSLGATNSILFLVSLSKIVLVL
jgi:hypothetical protein